jgi:nucleoid-associated protein YgaU
VKNSCWILIFFLCFLGCESVDHQKTDSAGTVSNEPAWASFAKENNMDWSEHYWSDREKKGNRGYLNSKPYTVSKSSLPSDASSLPKQEPAIERASVAVDTDIPQRGRQETMREISAPEQAELEERPELSVNAGYEKDRQETVETGPSENESIGNDEEVLVIQGREPWADRAVIPEKTAEKVNTGLNKPLLKPVKKTPAAKQIKIKEKTPVVQQSIPLPKKIEKTETKSTEYVVKKGENLWKIAGLKEIYGDSTKWQKIYDANRSKLKSPNHVYPGQVLIIPRE